MNERKEVPQHDANDHEPVVGNDPMSLPQTDAVKETIPPPDPEKVAEAERRGRGFGAHEHPGEQA